MAEFTHVEVLTILRNHGALTREERDAVDAAIVALSQPVAEAVAIVGWIHEDELPEGYPYDAMFPHSRVDLVRMFPVYAPAVAQPGEVERLRAALMKIAETKPHHGMNLKARPSDPPNVKLCWNTQVIAREALAPRGTGEGA